MVKPSDQKTVDLVQRVVQGDQDAFADLFHGLNAPVLNYVYRIVGDRPTAEDLTQDAFIRAHNRIDQLGPPWDFKSWVYRIAGNLAIDHLRLSKRFVDVEEVELMGDSTTRRPAERKAQLDEQRQEVWRTLDGMPTMYRQALILREFNELSYDEVSTALEVSYDSARQIVHRARVKFKDLHGIRALAAEARPHCSILDDMLSPYPDGELPESEVKRVRRHIRGCDVCQVAEKEKVRSLLALIPPVVPTAAWKAGVLDEATRQAAVRQPRSADHLAEKGSSASPGSSPAAGSSTAQPASLLAKAGQFLSSAWPALAIPAVGLVGAAALFAFAYLGPGGPGGMGGGADTPQPSPEASSAPLVLAAESETPVPVSPLTDTASPTATSTASMTPTPEPPTATGLQNVKCRRGPDMGYEIQTYLLRDETALITGRNQNDTWWLIERTDGYGSCWVWDGVVEVRGDLTGVSIVAAPPTYTPTPTEQADEEAPAVTIGYSPNGSGHPLDNEQITFSASARDNDAVDRIEIWVRASTDNQLKLVQTCHEVNSCSYRGGPYPGGSLRYQARAFDNSGNEGRSPEQQVEVLVVIY